MSQAVDCHRRIPASERDRAAERIDLLGRLLRAQVRAGAVAAARATRERAVELAERAGREELLVDAFAAWTEPTPWIARPYATVDEHAVAILTRLLRRADLDPTIRCRLLATLVTELAGEGDPRAAPAAAEAVELAGRLGDPALLALTRYEQAREASWDREPDLRARLAAEITRIGAEHGLVAYRWRGEYIAATTAAARNDLTALGHHIGRSLLLAQAYQLVEPLGVGLCSRAMLAHIAGRFDDAERRYAEACAHLEHHGRRTRLASPPWLWRVTTTALALCWPIHHGCARISTSRFFATLRSIAVVALGDRERAEELYAALLPVRDQVAGAASTSLAMRPVAHTLGELAWLLGRTAAATDHLAEAVAVAGRWQAPVWQADARAALAAIARGHHREPLTPARAGASAGELQSRQAPGSTGKADVPPAPLSGRELEVLRLVAAGLSDREIGERLVLSPHTVHRHVANIRTKLGEPSRAAAVAHAARINLI